MGKTVFFRNDDVEDCDIKFKKFIGLFLYHRIPIHLAVVPGNMTSRCEVFLRQCLKKYPDLIEIGQHGYKHVNYSTDAMSKYEFGPKRVYTLQRKDILKGQKILRKLTLAGLVFTPPWHGFDQNTLRIISELEYSGVSLDDKSKVPESGHFVRNILTKVYLNKKRNNDWYLENGTTLLSEINSLKDAYVGIQAHHNEIKDEEEFKRLGDFLYRLKGAAGIQFCKLSQFPQEVVTG